MGATGTVSGKDGGITFAGGYVVKTTSWTLNVAVEDVETTALGDAWRSRVYGIKEWSGSFATIVDTATFGSSTLTDLGIGINPAAITLTFDATATTNGKFTGTVMVTGMDVTTSVGGGATTATFTFVGSSTLTVTQAST